MLFPVGAYTPIVFWTPGSLVIAILRYMIFDFISQKYHEVGVPLFFNEVTPVPFRLIRSLGHHTILAHCSHDFFGPVVSLGVEVICDTPIYGDHITTFFRWSRPRKNGVWVSL